MITVTKQENGVLFTFQDSDKYLYGSGTIEVPFNSLSIIQDDSDMITLRKSASNDIFLAARYDTDLGYRSKDEAVEALKGMLFAETGGGSDSGMTPSEVQEMIDESVSGKADTATVNQIANEAAQAILSVSGDVQTNAANIADIWDTIDLKEEVIASALTEVRQDVAEIDAKEEVIASALTEVRQDVNTLSGDLNTVSGDVADKQDALQYYSEDVANASAKIYVPFEDENYNVTTTFEANGVDIKGTSNRENETSVVEIYHNADNGVGLYYDYTGETENHSYLDVSNEEITAIVGVGENETTFRVNSTGATINDERVLTESDGAYYISFATIATTGIRDEDWDGIVAAIDNHRPIYAGYPLSDGGILYYGVECMNKNVSNTQIVLTSSDDSSHYFYTFTKNGSNDYSYTVSTKPYVTDAEKTAWNAKQDALSAGTGIEISGNVISATGGGGATYSAGYGINIDTANTISFNMPITCTTNSNDNITIGNGTNNGNWSLLVGNDMSITNSNAAIGLCVSDMSVGGSSISGNTRGVLIGCQNKIKGGNINVGGGVVIGDRNESTDGGIAIGTASKASGSSTVAIGLSANATGTTKMNLNNQIKVDTNNQVYIKDKTNTTDVCIQDAIAALGGLKLVKISQTDYDQLVNDGMTDPDTLYIISNVVS